MGEGGCMYVVGEKKKERQGGTWVVKKKKKKWGVGFMCMVGKKGGVEKKEEEKFERQKTKLFLFVCSLCLVQSVEL
jgi:flavin-dependent dehydrogenase